MDDAGTFDELRHRHDALVSRMSPTARHQAFPTVYARPVPREATKIADPTLPLRGEIALLREELAAQKRENGRLAILLRELSRPMSQRIEPPTREVMEEFCRAMNAAGRNVGGQPWSDFWLTTKRRHRPVSHPRQVCMWLVREICPSPSFPMIARSFNMTDHTSIMYGCKQAIGIMDGDPGVRHVAMSVLRKFGVNTEALEKRDTP
tara:strand:+ start:152 stop:769 length:618 start_codon:yes stop_codon:yes gene_type:complete